MARLKLKNDKNRFLQGINRIESYSVFEKVCSLGVIAFLGFVSVSILWRLLTVKYPTHSDVFFMGVEGWCDFDLAFCLLVFDQLFLVSVSSAVFEKKVKLI
jgi:hypothetical protein